MLLCCTEDIYLEDKKTIIFTAGKTYRAILGTYGDQLSEEEKLRFTKIAEDYPYIKEMLRWTIIRAINDLKEPWIIEMIENPEEYNPANQFKNKHFVQISSFSQGL